MERTLFLTSFLLGILHLSCGGLAKRESGEYEADEVSGDVPCFGDYGCFPISYPWIDTNARRVAKYPEPPEAIKCNFLLYTRRNPKEPQYLKLKEPHTLPYSHFLPTLKTYVIAHGFLETNEKKWISDLKSTLLAIEDCNVIVIDWRYGSSPPYTQAVANVRVVGMISTFLLKALYDRVGLRTEKVHIIGHSLGGHLAGYIGSNLRHKFKLKVARISALDPAKPHFHETHPIVRLDPSDADFVDVIHTDATPFIQGGFGMETPIGHIDFYPNGGSNQPGCDSGTDNSGPSNTSFIQAIRNSFGCDHVRSYEYFLESMRLRAKCPFISIECESWQDFKKGNCFVCKSDLRPEGRLCSRLGMSSLADYEGSGMVGTAPEETLKLFTLTGSRAPYCRSLYRVTLAISESKESRVHKGEVGSFTLTIQGIKGNTQPIEIFPQMYFEPGSVSRSVVGERQVGRMKSAVLLFYHETTFNFITWRVNNAHIFLKNITIDNLEEDWSMTLCPFGGERMISGKEVEMRPCGRESRIDISASDDD